MQCAGTIWFLWFHNNIYICSNASSFHPCYLLGRAAYRGVLCGYAGICALWIPLVAWMMPNDSFKIGHIFLLRDDWKFEIRQRSELDRQYRRATTLQDFVAAASAAGGTNGAVAGTAAAMYGHQNSRGNGDFSSSAGLVGSAMPDSSDPMWTVADAAEEQRQRQQDQQWAGTMETGDGNHTNGSRRGNGVGGSSPVEGSASPVIGSASAAHPSTFGLDGAGVGPESMPLPPDVSWGPLVFEARRFVELRKKTFKEQFLSTESFGMGVFYTLNVFLLQFYLGTQRLQLDYKGDVNNAYANFGNVVVAFAFVTIPIIGWLLDKKGYGWTLGTINALAVVTSILQAIPWLWLQAITLVVWMVARFFMYSSYFAIFGGLFGFRNFGRLVAIDNTFNGLFGLLQYPLTYLAIHAFDGNFTAINVAQAIILLPLFLFCFFMYKWEREDLVPIRPLEGEELPCDMMGARTRKSLPPMHLPHIEMPHLPALRGGRRHSASDAAG